MLEVRSLESEQMDDLNLEGEKLNDALNGLKTINSLSGNKKIILKTLKNTLHSINKKEFVIVDLGCGGADYFESLIEWSLLKNLKIQLIGVDGNENILQKNQNRLKNFPNVEFIQANAFDDNFVLPKCDILVSSHFIYHFSDEQLIEFINSQAKQISHQIIFSDLNRSIVSYRLFQIFGRLFFFKPIIIKDGLLAIRRSFKMKEIKSLMKKSSFNQVNVQRKAIFRYLCTATKQ